MTTLEWFNKHLSSMFTAKGVSYSKGFVSRPTFYSGVGHRDNVYKSPQRFDYRLWNTLVFNAEDSSPFCKNKMSIKYTFYPCYASCLTQDRLNMIAEILNVPVNFHMDDGDDCELYTDGLLCSSVEIYPGCRKVIYNVRPIFGEPYMIVRGYNKEGEWND